MHLQAICACPLAAAHCQAALLASTIVHPSFRRVNMCSVLFLAQVGKLLRSLNIDPAALPTGAPGADHGAWDAVFHAGGPRVAERALAADVAADGRMAAAAPPGSGCGRAEAGLMVREVACACRSGASACSCMLLHASGHCLPTSSSPWALLAYDLPMLFRNDALSMCILM